MVDDIVEVVPLASANWRERLRYRFDNVMARGTPAMIGLLGVVSVLLVVVIGVLTRLLANRDIGQEGVGRALSNSLTHALSPSGVASDEGSFVFILLMVVVSIGGLFVVAALVGILTSGVNTRIEELRKGRSRVLESGHTVLLGWSEQVFVIIPELVIANESERGSCVVILADEDKVEMEDEIRTRVGGTGRTRVVCRSGSPMELSDLDIVNLGEAKSVIVLSPDIDQPDTPVIMTLLALGQMEWAAGRRPNVVAGVTDSRNLPAAQLAGGRTATVVDADDIAARLVVQTSRQAGLSVVCSDLLDFEGDEIYMRDEPSLVGHSFGDVVHAYETATAIGLLHPDGSVVLNPPMATRVASGDKTIVIAEDDSTIVLAEGWAPIAYDAITAHAEEAASAERILVLGWNNRAGKIVEQLDQYVALGSEVEVAAGAERTNGDISTLRGRLQRLRVGVSEVDTTDRTGLESLGVERFDHIVVLADDGAGCETADSRTLVTLLHLRDMEARRNEHYSIVSEMIDERNRRLAQVTKADDFVVGGKLISLLYTQLAENRHLAAVFGQLFEAEGSEIHLKPAGRYIRLGEAVTFATVIEAAGRCAETAIGYRIAGEAQEPPGYGVHLNPAKTATVTFADGDKVIVLAED
jgi:ion channel POLLUX/CASTOR